MQRNRARYYSIWVAPVPGVTGRSQIIDPVIIQDGADYWGWTYPDYMAVKDADTPLEYLAAWVEDDATLGSDEGAERARVAYATAEYFPVLGADPVRGRGFLPSEELGPGQHAVVVVSHDLWINRLGGRTDILGQTLTVNRTPYTVVGVAPEEFRGARVNFGPVDLWMPLAQYPGIKEDGRFPSLRRAFPAQVALQG